MSSKDTATSMRSLMMSTDSRGLSVAGIDRPDDVRFMALALSLGRRGLGNTWPNPAVAAVVVKDGVILGRGWTRPGGRPHAETEALGQAREAARGATLYTTLEPCSHHGKTPPCADAIIAAGIARVVSAMEDPNPEVAGQGHARLRASGVAVEVGVGAAEAQHAHAGHIRRVRDGRPHVTLKLAVSADEKAGLAGRRPAALTGDAVRERVHMMRSMSDAVLTGIGTVMSDDSLLTCRLPGMAHLSPVRVVLDSRLRLPLTSRLVQTAKETPLWVIGDEATPAGNEAALRSAGVEVLRAAGAGRPHLGGVLRALAERGITRLMVEAGPILAAAFLAANLVDEVALFRAPQTLGPSAIDALEGSALTTLTTSPRFVLDGFDRVGPDILETFRRV
jgi:diaminohydroxyphosphoribosylaminopyrimidine deaminase / 5-amino-6-(5-phosphoribosylamino)uracil reductase